MKHSRKSIFWRRVIHYTFLILCIPFILTGITLQADQLADIIIGPKILTVNPKTPAVTFILLRIAGPDGQMVCDQSSNGTALMWAPSGDQQNGRYSYEVRVGTANNKAQRSENQQKTLKTRPWISSGSIVIKDGAIVISNEKESSLFKGVKDAVKTALVKLGDFLCPSAYADVLHYDDVITTGSMCIGFDCADGESFSYDTIRLKENNLRIHFDDTSGTGTFPLNDWKILINDTTSGGTSYFSIEDATAGDRPFTIEAGAPANALYVDDYGRIGFGTSIPYVELHIADGDSPTIRLDQDGSAGWTAQRWDLLGNETNFFIRDVTNGSKLPFRIQPNTPSNALTLKSDGKVGIGTWSPSAPLELETTGTYAAVLFDMTDGATGVLSATSDSVVLGSKTDHPLSIVANDLQVATIDTGGNMVLNGNLELGSSREIKQDIKPVELTEAVEALNQLHPVKFKYIAHPADEKIGFIAEDVPDLVATQSRKTTSPMDVVAVLTKVVQEQQVTISELKEKIEYLEQEIKPRP